MKPNHKTHRAFAPSSAALTALALSFLATVAAAEAPIPKPDGMKRPVKIYLLSGQSNMTGRGGLGDLNKPAADQKATLVRFIMEPQNVEKYKFLYKEVEKKGRTWAVRDDVFITLGDWPHEGKEGQGKHGGVGPGYGGFRNKGFGPELGIGHALGDFHDERVLLVKVAFGANSLAGNFRPPSSGGTLGDKYPLVVKAVKEAIEHLPEIVPGYQKETGYEIAGFFWNQGEHDCTPEFSAEYEQNLANLIKDLRKEFNAPGMKAVIATTGFGGRDPKDAKTGTAPKGYENQLKVIEAQLAVPLRPEFKGTVATVETRDFYRSQEQFGGNNQGHPLERQWRVLLADGRSDGPGDGAAAWREVMMNQRASTSILLITSDQHRRNSAGCYGNRDVITPAMDRMAREGVRFTECLTAAPLCSPTRSTWQTGLHMHQHGCREGGIEDLGQFKGMADYLNEAGYQTCFIGKSHWHNLHEESGFVPSDQRMGWQEWYGTPPHDFYKTRLYNNDGSVRESFEGQYEPTLQTEWAMRFVGKQTDAQPWCVNVNFGLPHSVYGIDEYHDHPAIWKRIREINREYGFNIPEKWIRDESRQNPHITCPQHLMFRVVPQEFLNLYDRDRLTLDQDVEAKWEKLARYYYQEYYAMISVLDREIGRLMSYLESSGRLENTIVIYTSDHGDLLCSKEALRAKAASYQNALRVPLLVWGPRAGVARGISSEALTSSVDLLPTVLGFAGIEPPPNLPGKNMAPWALGKQGPVHDAIFAGLFNWRAVYDGDYLYTIKTAKEPSSWIPVRLTDVKRDSLDQVNLVESPDHAGVRQRLLRLLHNGIPASPSCIVGRERLNAVQTGERSVVLDNNLGERRNVGAVAGAEDDAEDHGRMSQV